MMCRLKDLSAYSLTHAEIMEQREGVEMLALSRFFGATSNPGLRKNQGRLQQLSEEAVVYEGRAEEIEKEIAHKKKRRASQDDVDENSGPSQPRLL